MGKSPADKLIELFPFFLSQVSPSVSGLLIELFTTKVGPQKKPNKFTGNWFIEVDVPAGLAGHKSLCFVEKFIEILFIYSTIFGVIYVSVINFPSCTAI